MTNIFHTCKRSLLLLLTILYFQFLYSQSNNIIISKVRSETGEDPGPTFAIAQDSLGYIWFGTIDGLYRFDGYNYKIYRNRKNDIHSIAGNTIRALMFGKNNKLWIGLQGEGIDCLDLNSGDFKHYKTLEKKGSQFGNEIWAIYQDHNGNIWVGGVGTGLYRLDAKTSIFHHFNVLINQPSDGSITIRSIFEDNNGLIWVGMIAYGLSAIDPLTGSIQNFRHDPNRSSSIGSNDIFHVFGNRENEIVALASGGGMCILNRNSHQFSNFHNIKNNSNSLISDLVFSAVEKRPKEYWIGTDNGFCIADLNHNQFINLQHETNSKNEISDDRIRAVFLDRNGIVWVATETGVDKIIEQDRFQNFNRIGYKKSGIPDGIIRVIYEDRRKNIWFSVKDKGIVKYNQASNKYMHYIHNSGNLNDLPANYISCIMQDSKGNFYLGGWGTGLFTFNEHSDVFKVIGNSKDSDSKLSDKRIQFIQEAAPGLLWIGTERGLNRYDIHTQKCSFLKNEDNGKFILTSESFQTNAYIKDSEGNLWLGTWSDGLYKVSFKDSALKEVVVKNWRINTGKNTSLNSNSVISLYLDGNYLWIGTFTGGLNCLNLISGKINYFTRDNGLCNNIIFAILMDNEHNLWLSTDHGLAEFDPATKSFQNFSVADGLQDDHFFWGAACKSMDGTLYFGGINGVNCFNPKNMAHVEGEISPVLTDIRVLDKSIFISKSSSLIPNIELSYDKNYITFEFNAFDYINPARIQYLSQLEGFDKDWQQLGGRRQITYSKLNPGYYNFKLKIANQTVDKIIQIPFIIHPPIWDTWYARCFFILAIITCLISFYIFRFKLLNRQKRKLEQLVIIRTKKIQDQKAEIQSINTTLQEQKEELLVTLSELKERQQQLIQSEKMAALGTLTSGVAHEINNPLNFINGGLNILNDLKIQLDSRISLEEESIYLEAFHLINSGIERISTIVNALKSFSLRSSVTLFEFSLTEIIESTLLILNCKMPKDISIERNYEFEGKIVIYPSQFYLVILNVLDNAIFALNQTSKLNKIIDIHTSQKKNQVMISIRNNGPRIPESNLHQIFDPFFTTKDPGQGTGLGLSISFSIIQEHHGNMFVQNLNEGVEFVIQIPYVDIRDKR